MRTNDVRLTSGKARRLVVLVMIATAAMVGLWPGLASASTGAPSAAITSLHTPASVSQDSACQAVRAALHSATAHCARLAPVEGAAGVRLLGAAVPLAVSPADGCVTTYGGHSQCSYTVSPRVTCGGYNGHAYWNQDTAGTVSIGTYGEVWDTCGDTTYVYLSWKQNAGLHGGDNLAGQASNFNSVGVNYLNLSPGDSIGGVNDVAVTVCSNYAYGWHCGTPDHV